MADLPEYDPKTLSQQRADHAWKCFTINAPPAALQAEHARLAQSLSQSILHDGLGPTCAFLLAKARNESADLSAHRAIYEQIARWVTARVYGEESTELMEQIVDGTSELLRLATAEAIALMVWMRRFSEAQHGDVRTYETNEEEANG